MHPLLLLLLAVCASLFWLFVVLVLSVFLHEVGHAVAAWAGGYRVTSFGIGSGRPLLLLRMPGSGTIFYLCRFGLRLSGITWVFFPGGTPSSVSNLFLACGGAVANGITAGIAALCLASFEVRSVPFLSVWVPTVVVLLVNSVLMLLVFVPRRTLSAEHGTLTSDSLQALAALFPDRFRGKQSGRIAVPLRTLSEKRAFWENIGDTTMLCVAMIRAGDAYREIGDQDAARACWEELSTLEVMPRAAMYQNAWIRLLSVQLENEPYPAVALNEAEKLFQAMGNKAGDLMVTRERLIRQNGGLSVADLDMSLSTLQAEAIASGDAAVAVSILADRVDLYTKLLQGGKETDDDTASALSTLERLSSQYDAARLAIDSSATDIRVYGRIASVRAGIRDDGGAAVSYERALAAARRVYAALAFMPDVQHRFAARQAPLIAEAVQCCRRLGRDADAARYARLLS
jgi:hypothetical protein